MGSKRNRVSKKVKIQKPLVYKALEAKGITMKELAHILGVNDKYLSECVNKELISERNLEKIGAVLNRAPAYFQGGLKEFFPPEYELSYQFHRTQEAYLLYKLNSAIEDLKGENDAGTKVPPGKIWMRLAIEGLIYYSFLNRRDDMHSFSDKQKKEMFRRAVHAADAYYMETWLATDDFWNNSAEALGYTEPQW